jgi:hypothetical protein
LPVLVVVAEAGAELPAVVLVQFRGRQTLAAVVAALEPAAMWQEQVEKV